MPPKGKQPGGVVKRAAFADDPVPLTRGLTALTALTVQATEKLVEVSQEAGKKGKGKAPAPTASKLKGANARKERPASAGPSSSAADAALPEKVAPSRPKSAPLPRLQAAGAPH